MQKTQIKKSIRKKAPQNPVYSKVRQDSKKDARQYVEGWRVPKGAE
tara:strand:+ start:705 stop:842 length:138 start_codon:yes stop_codon:yes gene_type:complete